MYRPASDLQWVNERLLMLMRRGDAPHITSRKLDKGELCFCFIGQVSSRARSPLVVDAHAISFRKGGGFQHRPLPRRARCRGLCSISERRPNGNVTAAQALIPSPWMPAWNTCWHCKIDAGYLRQAAAARTAPLTNWSKKRRQLLEDRISSLGDKHPRAKRYRKELEEMEAFLHDRTENWLKPNYARYPN